MMSPLVFAGFILAVGVSWLVKRAAVLDHPNQRSSHDQPIPRSGGLGVLAALGLGLVLSAVLGAETGVLPLAIAATGFGCLGLWDDLAAPTTLIKFIIVMVLASTIAGLTGPVQMIGVFSDGAVTLPFLLGFAGSVLWIFVAANAANFMDGSDGITVAMFVPVGLGLAFVGEGAVAFLGLFLAAGLVGFAVFNVPKAVLFLGDVGSLTIGAVVATAALLFIENPTDVWLFPLLMLPVLTDVLLTLVGKIRHRIGFLAPHRTHAYQLLIRMGCPHWKVALVYFGLSAACTSIVCVIHQRSLDDFAFAAFVAGVLVLSTLHAIVRFYAQKRDLLEA